MKQIHSFQKKNVITFFLEDEALTSICPEKKWGRGAAPKRGQLKMWTSPTLSVGVGFGSYLGVFGTWRLGATNICHIFVLGGNYKTFKLVCFNPLGETKSWFKLNIFLKIGVMIFETTEETQCKDSAAKLQIDFCG